MDIQTMPFVLRRWRHGDEESLVKHANHFQVSQYLKDNFPHPYTMENAREWVRLVNLSDRECHRAIAVNGEPVGCIGIAVKNDVYRKSAELGYWLGPDYWNCGIMTRAVKQMVKYTFEHYDINRIFARVFDGNDASIRVLKKAGFAEEGILRKAVYKNNRYIDEYLFGLVR